LNAEFLPTEQLTKIMLRKPKICKNLYINRTGEFAGHFYCLHTRHLPPLSLKLFEC